MGCMVYYNSVYGELVNYLVNWCLMALSAQTGIIVPYEYEIYHIGPRDKKNTSYN